MQRWWFSLNQAFALSGFLISPLAVQAALPTFEQVRSRDVSSELILLDRNGLRFDSVRLNAQFRKAQWVSLDDIAPLARQTLIQMEDQHFFEHDGVDWFALTGSALKTLRGGQARGASTITMQLISLIDQDHPKSGKRNLEQKIDQIKAALELEKTWTKKQILEAYLNLVPLRGELIGIHAVSLFLFDKEVSAMNPVDSALFVAMLPAPNAGWKKISERACVFLNRVYEKEPANAKILCESARTSVAAISGEATAVKTKESEMLPRLAGHYAQFFVEQLPIEKRLPGTLKTTLDIGLQQRTHDLAKESLLSISKNNVGEIAAVVFDNLTGEILSYLGNLRELSSSPEVDGLQGRRQVGSTLKPFFYALALQNKKFELGSNIKDEPLQIETSNGAFKPENYDKTFHGWVSLPTALASSMNIPAIKVVEAVGVDEAVELLKKLEFSGVKSGYIYGPSLALGTVDLSLYELTRAYRLFARQALGTESKAFPLNQDSVQKITRVLSDNVSRSMTFGMNSILNTPYFTAVKTGTSKDMRDNWCVGFSDRYTVGVWVGNFKGAPMRDVSGVSGAAPLWRKLMDYLNRDHVSQVPPAIAKIVISEEPVSQVVDQARLAKITYPKEGALIAFDPEIPSERQKVLFESSSHDSKQEWFLNNEKLGTLSENLFWKVTRGLFTLEIREKDRVLDSIRFKVR